MDPRIIGSTYPHLEKIVANTTTLLEVWPMASDDVKASALFVIMFDMKLDKTLRDCAHDIDYEFSILYEHANKSPQDKTIFTIGENGTATVATTTLIHRDVEIILELRAIKRAMDYIAFVMRIRRHEYMFMLYPGKR